jgi:two-component system alkaline phosphatase synthesis response regulator PhoP
VARVPRAHIRRSGAMIARSQEHARAAPTKVLVVDDEADIRHIARIALTRLGGMQVVEAASADEGVQAAAREQPDVILLDCMMPGRDGVDALRALRENPDTADIPVVFLTAKAGLANHELLQRLGACGLVMKPFDPTTLAERVRALLSGTERRHSTHGRVGLR